MSPAAKPVGILGGGQLGLMLAESLDRLDCEPLIFEADPNSPCALRRKRNVFSGSLSEFFSRVAWATFDSENIRAEPLVPFASQLVPSLRVLETSQNRAKEKAFLRENGFRPVQFQFVPPGDDLRAAANEFGFPCIAKSVLGGYDGKGQFRLKGTADLTGVPENAPGGWVLEEVLSLRAEISCIVARDGAHLVAFPVFENIHTDHILDFTVVPARVERTYQDEALAVAAEIATVLEVRGLLTVEFFIGTGRDGVERLFVNELAPRVHNSGHVTRQACTLSQFDVLASILAGRPLVQPALRGGGWCMGQLLGDLWLKQGRAGGPLDLSAWDGLTEISEVYEYGKLDARSGRKMGHFVVRGTTADSALKRAAELRATLE